MKSKKLYNQLYNKLYYIISFRPSRTINNKMKGNEHYMTNTELYEMRTRQALKFLTFKNVLIVKLHNLKTWLNKNKSGRSV
jgi:hypothetical protein